MQAFEVLSGKLAEWIDAMRNEPITPAPMGFKPLDTPPREGVVVPTQIANCTYAIPAPHYSHPDSVFLTIGAQILWLGYIMTEVRLKGNAYLPCFAYDPLNACLYQGSCSDPHIARTLNIFEQTADYIKQAKMDTGRH